MRLTETGCLGLSLGLVAMLAGCSEPSTGDGGPASWAPPAGAPGPGVTPKPAEPPPEEPLPVDPVEEDDPAAPMLTKLPPRDCGDPHWTWENPTPGNDRFSGIWGSAANDIRATTTAGDVFHYDGTSWKCEQRLGGLVDSISGCAADDVWAVGPAGAVYRYDGTGWYSLASGITADLSRVFCSGAGDVWFIGAQGKQLYHSKGGLLRTRRLSLPADITRYQLSGIWGTSRSNLWLAGEKNQQRNLLLRWNGTRWSIVDTGITAGGLFDVRGTSAADIWAVGRRVMLHYDGSSLHSLAEGVDLHNTYYLWNVWPSSPNDVWVGGEELWHYDGAAWALVDQVRSSWWNMPMWSADGSDVWLGSRALYHSAGSHDGTAWAREGQGTLASIGQIWGTGPANLWALAGAPTNLLHYDGVSWSPQPGPTTTKGTLSVPTSIWGTGSSDLWVTAERNYKDSYSGALFHFDGTTWTEIPAVVVGEVPRFAKLRGSGAADLWLVGTNADQSKGLIKHFDGAKWTTWTTDARYVTAIYGSGPGDAWAYANSFVDGDPKYLLHYDGTSWTPVNTGPELLLYSLFGFAANDLWGLGMGNHVFHFDGVKWSEVDTGMGWAMVDNINGISGSGPKDVWLVSSRGRIAHYDGAWHDLSTTTTLNSIFSAGPNQVWVGVYGGAILRYRP